MRKIKILIALLVSLILILLCCSCSDNNEIKEIGGDGRSTYLSFEVDKALSQRGRIAGTIETSYLSDKKSIYFGDEKGNRIEGFTDISGEETEDGLRIDLVIPPDARSIAIEYGNGKRKLAKIPQEYLVLGDSFVFGALSDIHFNKHSTTGGDDALVYFDLALDYFEEIDADFVGVAGDISVDGEITAIEKFNEVIKDREYPVFTVSGNHDANAIQDGSWKSGVNQSALQRQDCYFAENGIDFVYAPQDLGGDVFVFLNQVRWEYSTVTSRLLDSAQLKWLRSVLEEYKDEQVYLFFHTFLCGPDGEKHTGVGNIKNPGGYTYPLPYTFGTKDEVIFRGLLRDYKNVVFFSGHSHWMFEMEIYAEWANYSNFNGEYCHMVHVPSVTEPRYIGENDTNRTGKTGEFSQGWVVYDYRDVTILIPIDFISQTYYTEYMEIIYN